jgi:hypothetical protein
MLTFPNFLDNTSCGEIRVNCPMPQGRFLVISVWAELTKGVGVARRIRGTEKCNIIGNHTHNHPVCSTVP